MALSKMTSRRSGGAQGQRVRLGCCNVPITFRLQLENVATSLGPSSLNVSWAFLPAVAVQETGARLVFSNRNDYFPDTKYRV
jgi:hypothetical protein